MSSSRRSAKSIRNEQVILKCQICEHDARLQWKCLECQKLMCQNCKEIVHPKFHSDHTVIDIKDVGKEKEYHRINSQFDANFSKLKCDSHSTETSYHFCKSCDVFICAKCVAKKHKGHDFVEVREEYTSRIEKIKTEHDNILTRIVLLSEQIDGIFADNSVDKLRYNDTKSAIKNLEKILIDSVRVKSAELQKELDSAWSSNTEMKSRRSSSLEEKQRTLQDTNDKINSILESSDAGDVFRSFRSIMKACEENSSHEDTQSVKFPNFVPGDISNISETFGKMEYYHSEKTEDLEIVNWIETDLDSVNDIQVSPDESLWIANDELQSLQNAVIQERNLHIRTKLKSQLLDMAILPSGEPLVSVLNSSVLKYTQLDKPKLVDSVFSVSPLVTLAVHLTDDNHILVGAAERGDWFPVRGPRQVILMDMKGRWRHIFEFDGYRRPLFTVPARVASNSLKNIAVLDVHTTDLNGRIVILDRMGRVLNVYKGHPEITNEMLFHIEDITNTNDDNFLVSESTNHMIHILNPRGSLVSYIDTKLLGIEFPKSLTVNKKGTIYIGCGKNKKKEKGARIFVLKSTSD